MPLFLAALSSATFGVADFVGGFATRRAPAVSVVWGSHVVALTAVAILAPLTASGAPPQEDLLWGAAGGVAGSIGLVVFYHALATTRIGVAAPVAAIVGTALPVAFGVFIGERPTPLAWAGILAAVPAVAVLAGGSRAGGGTPARAAGLGAAAGVAFALFGILVSRTGADSGLWPLAGARVASLIFLSAAAMAQRRAPSPEGAWGLSALAGVLDITANVFFLLAVRQELLSLVVVIMSLYPVTTIALARVVLDERVSRRQWIGLVVAATAVVTIALGASG